MKIEYRPIGIVHTHFEEVENMPIQMKRGARLLAIPTV